MGQVTERKAAIAANLWLRYAGRAERRGDRLAREYAICRARSYERQINRMEWERRNARRVEDAWRDAGKGWDK